jgi:hypothetical protein
MQKALQGLIEAGVVKRGGGIKAPSSAEPGGAQVVNAPRSPNASANFR